MLTMISKSYIYIYMYLTNILTNSTINAKFVHNFVSLPISLKYFIRILHMYFMLIGKHIMHNYTNITMYM